MSFRIHPHLLRDARAVAAIEFALVGAAFVMFLLAVIGAGLHYYFQQALDFAAQEAVRQVQLGHVPANYTEADFVTNVLCPAFSPFHACTNLFVDVRPVTDYEELTAPGVTDAPNSAGTGGFVFCAGTPGELMYAHIVYSPPVVGTLFPGTVLGSAVIVSSVAFANENPIGATVVQGNGC